MKRSHHASSVPRVVSEIREDGLVQVLGVDVAFCRSLRIPVQQHGVGSFWIPSDFENCVEFARQLRLHVAFELKCEAVLYKYCCARVAAIGLSHLVFALKEIPWGVLMVAVSTLPAELVVGGTHCFFDWTGAVQLPTKDGGRLLVTSEIIAACETERALALAVNSFAMPSTFVQSVRDAASMMQAYAQMSPALRTRLDALGPTSEHPAARNWQEFLRNPVQKLPRNALFLRSSDVYHRQIQ